MAASQTLEVSFLRKYGHLSILFNIYHFNQVRNNCVLREIRDVDLGCKANESFVAGDVEVETLVCAHGYAILPTMVSRLQWRSTEICGQPDFERYIKCLVI